MCRRITVLAKKVENEIKPPQNETLGGAVHRPIPVGIVHPFTSRAFVLVYALALRVCSCAYTCTLLRASVFVHVVCACAHGRVFAERSRRIMSF